MMSYLKLSCEVFCRLAPLRVLNTKFALCVGQYHLISFDSDFLPYAVVLKVL